MNPKEIICLDSSMHEDAALLSRSLNIPIQTQQTESDFLEFKEGLISVVSFDKKQSLRFTHSFDNTAIQRRLQAQDQHLLKAFKDKQKQITSILDLTAGWCRDSFILAQNNYKVTAVEHSDVVYFLTQHSLTRYKKQTEISLELLHQNSYRYLMDLNKNPDAIYLDPMFPSTHHQAKNKKEIQLLQTVTKNTQIEAIFTLALKKAEQRVVVKRPLHSEFLNQQKPSFQFKGKTIRFDIYQCA